MLQLYITSTQDVGFYFLYDPVKDDIYEGCYLREEKKQSHATLQTKSLHDALVHLTHTKGTNKSVLSYTDILTHAPVKIYIQNAHVRSQFKEPWKYDNEWKIIATKRRKLKYFEPQTQYHISELPPATQALFQNHLDTLQRYQDNPQRIQYADTNLSAVSD